MKSVKGPPSSTQTHPVTAPPKALKSHPGFVVSPGGAGMLRARSIKAAAVAVAAQSYMRPAVGTVLLLEAPGTPTPQPRQPGFVGIRVAK